MAVATTEEIESLLRALDDAPRHLAALTRDLDDSRLQRRPRADAWSPNEILAHLRACADVWGRGILAMIDQDHPTLRYLSPRAWIRKTDYSEQPFQPSLQAFVAQRDDLIRTLRTLDRADWSRGATFTGTVRGRDQTILDYVRRIVEHEREHRQQIEETLNAP
jgi:hypothetical protein